jgi:hypothetical protein
MDWATCGRGVENRNPPLIAQQRRLGGSSKKGPASCCAGSSPEMLRAGSLPEAAPAVLSCKTTNDRVETVLSRIGQPLARAEELSAEPNSAALRPRSAEAHYGPSAAASPSDASAGGAARTDTLVTRLSRASERVPRMAEDTRRPRWPACWRRSIMRRPRNRSRHAGAQTTRLVAQT